MNVLVLDVGGTAIKYAIMSKEGEFIEKDKVDTPRNSIETFVEVIGRIYDKYKNQIEGMAMSMLGRIDSHKGYAYTGGALTYNNEKNIVDILQKRCPVPIKIENDGKCAALAEATVGSLSQCKDGMVVILGTGIGGGIIKDGKVHKGANFIAGEFSAIIINPEEPKFWAMECGVHALLKEAAKVKGVTAKDMDGVKLFDMVNGGDKEAIDVLDKYCYKLVVQLFNLQYIYNPEKIAIGGGISSQDVLMEYIQRNLKKVHDKIQVDFPWPTIVRCEFRNDSNLIGALFNYLQ